MATKIKVGQLSEAIEDITGLYSARVVEGIKDVTTQAMKDMVKQTKAQRYKQDTGKYRRAISSRVVVDNPRGRTEQWYVKKPHYRLSHLLEHGHKTRGKPAVAYGFITKAYETVEEEYLKNVEEVIKNG